MSTPDLTEAVERLREEVLKNFERFGDLRFEGDIEWYESRSETSSPVIGVDSSYYSRIYKYIYLYIIRGVSIPRSIDRDLSRCIQSSSFGDAHFIASPATEESSRKTPPPIKELKKILSHRTRDLEVEIGERSYECVKREYVGEEPLVMMDGSARSFLPYRFKGAGRIVAEALGLEKSWENRLKTIDKLSESMSIVFISKTQSRTYYSEKLKPYLERDGSKIEILVPDVILIDSYLSRRGVFRNGVRTPGFSEPVLYENRDPHRRITLFYAVFQKGGGMYQISLLGDHTRELEEIRSL
ncbi:MAG: DNA double-strand break repair nuclease NurA, partial [Sulfolobales archaeon]